MASHLLDVQARKAALRPTEAGLHGTPAKVLRDPRGRGPGYLGFFKGSVKGGLKGIQGHIHIYIYMHMDYIRLCLGVFGCYLLANCSYQPDLGS